MTIPVNLIEQLTTIQKQGGDNIMEVVITIILLEKGVKKYVKEK